MCVCVCVSFFPFFFCTTCIIVIAGFFFKYSVREGLIAGMARCRTQCTSNSQPKMKVLKCL